MKQVSHCLNHSTSFVISRDPEGNSQVISLWKNLKKGIHVNWAQLWIRMLSNLPFWNIWKLVQINTNFSGRIIWHIPQALLGHYTLSLSTENEVLLLRWYFSKNVARLPIEKYGKRNMKRQVLFEIDLKSLERNFSSSKL